MTHLPDDDRTLRGPEVPLEEPAGDMLRRCSEERDELTPHETADCAGLATIEAYENEEDGGS